MSNEIWTVTIQDGGDIAITIPGIHQDMAAAMDAAAVEVSEFYDDDFDPSWIEWDKFCPLDPSDPACTQGSICGHIDGESFVCCTQHI